MTQLPLSPAPDRDVFSVSRLNREAKALLEGSFPLLWVEGELSNLSRPASGHLYFTLKDAQAQVRCALFRGSQRHVSVTPKDGMQVLVRARVSLYEGRGDYQLIVESLEEAGEGALRRAYEQLRNRLAQEGLFDSARKQPLPRLAKRIGIITSPSGAVLHDILTTLKRRFPAIPVLLHPVPVQGEGAAEKIAAMIRLAGQRRDCDVLILARGGGSLEDLWAFNEEVVARAIHACPIPIVCGVGHETDITIADFAADARAPTPTAAAEMLSPHQSDWLSALEQKEQRLVRLLRDRLRTAQQHLDYLSTRLVHPRERLTRLSERLQQLNQRLRLAQFHVRARTTHNLLALHARLLRHNPQTRLREQHLRSRHLHTQLGNAMRRVLERAREHMTRTAQALDTLSPLATLARGYAILENPKTGVLVRAASEVRPGDAVRARLARGLLDCRVEKVHNDA
ncbi:MAG TPA: exodeoxyribonuclease VII large subunit [Acidiferrobacterales bacterium]|nr:exodeoxyribonuclease VII large subunit [Acidiferrobacterales bacterium]